MYLLYRFFIITPVLESILLRKWGDFLLELKSKIGLYLKPGINGKKSINHD